MWLARSGYMAPEYAIYGQFSTKSDVFSYGVLVLEIVSGRKSIGARHGETVEDLLSFVSLYFLLIVSSLSFIIKLLVSSHNYCTNEMCQITNMHLSNSCRHGETGRMEQSQIL